ncbi:hypothetical protein [Butyrivibrio sp. LB2008]|uniref:hypothetical protein n=1 Tax=Butyrivibrio sp. LB2008 TaxID=1408305 RepID=UPI0004793AEC|nr:hypothetical protein [Butyrivibrio sp. LB2008]
MNRNNKSGNILILLLFPVILVGVSVISYVLSCILEALNAIGSLHAFFSYLPLWFFFFAPIPCAILGLVGAFKAKKAGIKSLFIAGLAEMAVLLVVGIWFIRALFTTI